MMTPQRQLKQPQYGRASRASQVNMDAIAAFPAKVQELEAGVRQAKQALAGQAEAWLAISAAMRRWADALRGRGASPKSPATDRRAAQTSVGRARPRTK